MPEPLSHIEISKKNLIANVRAIRGFIGRDVSLAAVIKANAYGHGQNEVASVLEPYVDYFQVDDVEELRLLRTVTQKPTFVFGYVAKNELEESLRLNAILNIYDLERLRKVSTIARKLNITPTVHIKIDACLGRQGLLIEEVSAFLKQIKKITNVHIGGVYSHFANIEDTTDNSHALKQIETFKKAVVLFQEAGFSHIQTHISATSGILVYEKKHLQNPIVRFGIGTYGMWPSEGLQKKFHRTLALRPVMRWVSHIAQIKTVPKGYTIGYGLTYQTKRLAQIAVIPQGYSDGYDRGLSNCGKVLIGGKRCRVLGRVAMNMFVVDVSKVKNARVEDEVVLLGTQGQETITAEELAKKIDTINYEITTRISPLLPRRIV
ncbi:MAG TPA: alanine racemase [Patescibacteria group bacterium]|nr:alanine racemase [Patescibacteria group bacterium]